MLGRPGQDSPSQDPRRHPRRPVQARAPRRPRHQRDRRHRPRGVEPLPVLLRPLGRADRHRGAGHGAGGGHQPRARRHRHLTGRLPRRAGGAPQPRGRSRRPLVAGSPGPPSPTPPPTTGPSWPGSTREAPFPSEDIEGRHRRRRRGIQEASPRSSRRHCTSRSSATGCCVTARTPTRPGSRYRNGRNPPAGGTA